MFEFQRAGIDPDTFLGKLDHFLKRLPTDYRYAPGYYAVFFYDPDGIKLEIRHRP